MALPTFAKTPEDEDQFSILIDGKKFVGWTEAENEAWLDSYSTVGFSAPFESDRKEFRDTFRPFSYKPVELYVGDEKQFTGTLINVEPDSESDSTTVKVSCYARPAVLHDCVPPQSAFPLQFDGMVLLQIMQQIAQPFGFSASIEKETIARDGSTIDVEFEKKKVIRGKRGGIKGGQGSKFARLTLNPTDNPQDFLAGLAKLRGGVLCDDVDGNLLFRNSVQGGSPVARFSEGSPGAVSVKANFNPQDYPSEVTAFTPARRGRKGAQYTQPNPLIPNGIVRPMSFKPDDTDKAEASDAAKARLARIFANVCSWEITVPSFRDPQGKLFIPNTTLTLLWPSAFVYTETELLIRSVKRKQDGDSNVCTLTAVFLGAFSGQFPDAFPWDDPDLVNLRKLAH